MEMIEQLTQIFQYDFMVRAFVAGFVVSVVAPLTGVFLVLRRYGLLVDTLAHVSLIGVATALLTGFSPILGAAVASVGAGIFMENLREKQRILPDSLMSIFISGSLALTMIILTLGNGFGANIFNYLFGSITSVNREELLVFLIFGIITATGVTLLRKKLFLISYDEELARVNGLNVGLYNLALMIMVGLIISLSIRVVGALLIGALMVIPVTTAIQLGYGFSKTVIAAVGLSVISVLSGLYISFYLDIPGSAAIIVCMLVFFVISLFLKHKNV